MEDMKSFHMCPSGILTKFSIAGVSKYDYLRLSLNNILQLLFIILDVDSRVFYLSLMKPIS